MTIFEEIKFRRQQRGTFHRDPQEKTKVEMDCQAGLQQAEHKTKV